MNNKANHLCFEPHILTYARCQFSTHNYIQTLMQAIKKEVVD